MTEQNYKQQINDYRDIGGYWDIVFGNMKSLTIASFRKQLQQLTDSLREMVINAAYDVEVTIGDKEYSAEDLLEKIDEEYEKVCNLKGEDLSTAKEKELAEEIDKFLKFTYNVRISLNRKLSIKKILPHSEKTRQQTQSQTTKGSSL